MAAAHDDEQAKMVDARKAKVKALEEALQRNPDDMGLRITLRSARRLADRMGKEAVNGND